MQKSTLAKKSSGYKITNVRKGNGVNEYVVTVVRDGVATGDVVIRAASKAPSYWNGVEEVVQRKEQAELVSE